MTQAATPDPTPDADDVLARVVERAPSRVAARRAVSTLVANRRRQELAAQAVERSIHQLAELGATQRDIAALAGVSQAEVSRRIKRRHLTTGVERVQEIALQRSEGRLDSAATVDALASAMKRRRSPRRISAYDGASTSSRTAAEFMNLYTTGVITREEYEAVRARLAK